MAPRPIGRGVEDVKQLSETTPTRIEPSAEPGPPDDAQAPDRWRFARYSSMSLVTVPLGYALLVTTRQLWDINAGLLNLAVGTAITLPSFLLYRRFVWRRVGRHGFLGELLSFWFTVLAGAAASTALITLVDWRMPNTPWAIVLAGLVGQGVVFVGRYLWLNRVTFRAAGSSTPG